MSFKDMSAGDLVTIYFDCRDSKTFPAPGGILQQTAYTMNLFRYLDLIVADYRKRMAASRQSDE